MDWTYGKFNGWLRFIMISLLFVLPVAACMGCAKGCTGDPERLQFEDMTGRYGKVNVLRTDTTYEECRILYHEPRVMLWYISCGNGKRFQEYQVQGEVLFEPATPARRARNTQVRQFQNYVPGSKP